ncbi:CHRD domain-containing protein [Hymenobacter sp. HSC-4F20]|uniref:CHRD domain-containing protein n=1 Tax=Hymenobacter sp. HSC-4F20 TaxID=2864135 RepID=UPI001C7312C6|nr:CHRD domain-containing protein [Hymenobacter sp. HSC-4F20]MBX0291180.1 CHRD domain-containing protein [Hymenobacter sp. HSC-4F20]
MNLKTTALFLLLAGSCATIACKKDDDTTTAPATDVVQLAASLDGKQEVGPNSSTASGTMTGSYNKATRVLSYTVTYQGITPTMGHIHRGAAGTNGDPFVAFPNVASPITGSSTLSEADAALLLGGQTYVNLHTTAYPGGEIRGKVSVK